MKVMLMRHGQAHPLNLPSMLGTNTNDKNLKVATTDAQRQLTDFGWAQARQSGGYIANLNPSYAIVSPYDRAKQTLQGVIDILKDTGAAGDDFLVQVCDVITPEDSAIEGLKALDILIADREETVLVVCHMSIVAKLASLLTGTELEGFELGEVRVYEMPSFGENLATETARFVPDQP